MNHSDIDHENMTSAYLKVIRGEKQEILKEVVTPEGEQIDEARLVTRDGKFIVMTDNDTEAATFEDRESALEYIKNNKEKLMVRDDKAKPATTNKIEAKEGKEVFIVPEEIVDTKERNAFMGAAAAAHKAGKSHFNFAGKKHKVTMSKDTAKAINNSVKEDARDHCHSKDHDCATIVHHPKWGIGKPIYESHAIPTDDGYVAWYDVEFDHGIEREVPTKDMTVYTTEKHKMNAAKKVKEEMKCGPGQYYCKSSGTCKPIPDGMKVDDNGDLVKEAVKYPHAMYDPKTGEKVMAKTPADHNKYDKMGYTHEKPKIDENNPAHFAAIAKANAKRDKEMGRSPIPNMNDPKFKMTKRDGTKDRMNPTGALTGYRSKIESANPMSKLTPTQRQALSRMKVKKKGDVTLPGMDLLKKDEKPKMKPGRQSQIVKYEGYEADVSKFMNKHGIDHHWSGGKLHVDKKDHAHAEKKLKKKYDGYGPRGAKMMPQLHINKESTMVTRSNWLEKFYEKRNSVNEDYKQSPHAGGDDTKDSFAKQLSTRKGEEAFVKAHEIQTPEYADGPTVNMKTFKAMTAGVNGPKYRSNDNSQGDKTPVAPVNVGKAGGVGAKD